MHEDGRAVLSDFELSRQSRSLPGEDDISASSSVRAGTKGYMAPEVESGEGAVFASDMYSFGVLLMFMHYPALASNIIPGSLRLPPSCEIELADLIQHLTAVCCYCSCYCYCYCFCYCHCHCHCHCYCYCYCYSSS